MANEQADLAVLGVTESVAFPDLDGLARRSRVVSKAGRQARSPAFDPVSGLLIVSAHDVDGTYFFKKEHGTTALFCERVANRARHCGRVRRRDVRHRGHDDPPFADRHHGHDLDAQQFAVVATRRSSKRLE